MAISPATLLPFLKGTRPYALYVLCVLMIVFMLNQKDRFLLGVTSDVIARDLQFGELTCLPNYTSNFSSSGVCNKTCVNFQNEKECNDDVSCTWTYTPLGLKYELLAGPFFTFVFTLATIPLGILASNKWVNRRVTLSIFLMLWSSMTLASAFTHHYWQFLLARLGLGLFEAVCTPFASSIISDYFQKKHRGAALGFYNWGIYLGYSIAFSFDFVLKTDSLGWRWVYTIASLPGFVMAIVMLLTVREPARQDVNQSRIVSVGGISLFKTVARTYLQPALILLCVAGGVRLGAGLVWAYNVKTYFNELYCRMVDVGAFLSWVPIVGGTLGALFGGFLSDKFAGLSGYKGRMWVLILSQIFASPFLVGAVYLYPIPWAFLSLIPAYLIGEAWLGICLTVAIELVPIEVSPASIALFLFISNNISSLAPLLLPVLKDFYGLQRAMLILFPGLYVISAFLFSISLLLLILGDFCKKSEEVKVKTPGQVKEASRQRRRRRRRRRTQARLTESSPLVEERNYGIQGPESDSSDSISDDFVEIDEREQSEAQAALESAAAVGGASGGRRQRSILSRHSRGDCDRGEDRGRGYGAVDITGVGASRHAAEPAPVIGSISEWSVCPSTAEEKRWLAESQEGI